MYSLLFHTVLARMDPERAHRLAFGLIRTVAAVPGLRSAVAAVLAPAHPTLRTRALGLDLPGPFGLAAGFDKNATGVDGLTMTGFDFVEIGTVTARPQPGNPPRRLFRLLPDRALVNRMGFNNEGSAAVAARLARRLSGGRASYRKDAVVGVNIGKTKAVPEGEAIADYVTSTERLAPYADYLVVNVSSPNTPGLRDLQTVDRLRPLLAAVRDAADRVRPPAPSRRSAVRVPLLVKIAPDLADEDIDAVADLAVELRLDGVITTNTTISREGLTSTSDAVAACGAGGLSGAPLRDRSLAVLRRLRTRVGDRVTLIGVGGVETADDVWDRIRAGASLVQGYSGFVYQGPGWARDIHRGLVDKLAESPYDTLAEVVGTESEEAAA